MKASLISASLVHPAIPYSRRRALGMFIGISILVLFTASSADASLIGQWTFESNADDITGNFGSTTLYNGATVSNGRLLVSAASQSWASTATYSGGEIHAMTLVSWLHLDSLEDRGGSAITLEGNTFDGIVYAEREPYRWMSGSSGYARTQDVNGPDETAIPNELLQIAIVYTLTDANPNDANDTITIYRNGVQYGDSYNVTLFGYVPAVTGADIVFGRRHTSSNLGDGNFLTARIEEARIYDEALTPTALQSLVVVPEPSSLGLMLTACAVALRRGRWQGGWRVPCNRGTATNCIGERLLAACALVLLGLTTGVHAVPSYTILDLGTLGGTNSYTEGINASGQVIGFSNTPGDASTHAFRTESNSMMTTGSDLGIGGGTNSFASGINASGQVVGRTEGNGFDLAFRTAPGGIVTSASYLGTLGGSGSRALGINDSGQAVGSSSIAGNMATHAFRTAPNGSIDAASDLGTLGGTQNQAFAINASGQAVGSASTSGATALHAFRTAPNGPITLASDLGTLGGTDSEAYGVNDSGQVVGYSTTTGNAATHAFRTAANGPITAASDLGTLGGNSYALSINASGQTVGFFYLAGSAGTQHAFFADTNGVMQDLNDLIPGGSGWVLNQAHGINDLGQICSDGLLDGQSHSFLLTPMVPEPSATVFLFGVCVAFHRRRRSSW